MLQKFSLKLGCHVFILVLVWWSEMSVIPHQRSKQNGWSCFPEHDIQSFLALCSFLAHLEVTQGGTTAEAKVKPLCVESLILVCLPRGFTKNKNSVGNSSGGQNGKSYERQNIGAIPATTKNSKRVYLHLHFISDTVQH